jgi:hypothetical protein
MRVLVIVKADQQIEAGVLPTEQQLRDMGNFNQKLVDAGIMLAGEGLHPSSKGKRLRFERGRQSVIDGPFAETKELVAGFWILKVKDVAEAVTLLKNAPFEPGAEIEIRPIFEADDFGAEFTPELRAQEDRQRARMAQQQK